MMKHNNIIYESFHDKTDKVVFFQRKHGPTSAHFHRCIEILYVIDGALDCNIDGENFCAQKDDIIFVHKCGIHQLYPAPDYTNYVLIIGQRYSDDFTSFFQTKTLPAHLKDKAFNYSLMQYFESLNKITNTTSEMVKKGYIQIILGSLLSHYQLVPVKASLKISIIIDALNYIDEHFTQPISLDDISNKFGYNKYYFSRLFNSYIGENLNNYINMVRIQNLISSAKKSDNPNLSDLVFLNGFDSMTTFYRNFYKYYDRPPKEIFKEI